MDKLYRVVIIDDDEFSADNLCLELKKYNRLSIDSLLYFFSSRQRLSAENSSSSIITTLYSLSIVNNPALVINGTKVLKHVLTHKPDTPVMEL